MPFLPSPIPPPVFDSDESDAASQQSNDSSSYLSSQFTQHTRLSFSPKFIFSQRLPIHSDDSSHSQDDTMNFESTLPVSTGKKRKRSEEKSEQVPLRTPNQSPHTRRKNLDYVQEKTFHSLKVQRRSRHNDESLSLPSVTSNNLININPFAKHRYHTRLVAKRQSLVSLCIQRFEEEFHHESFLGYGEFSHVYLCTNRLDGLNYAIKSSKQPILGTSYEQLAWREICAYAMLTSHENLVRYYSAWIESDGRFFIQLEYCNGGSLEDVIEKNRQAKTTFDELELTNILHQISDVLAFIHGKDLAHLDIKPANIMICQYSNNDVRYKLTDLGHVSQISSCTTDEDGDSRYLALEMIQTCTTKKINLDKCDIFSLGLTLYVCGTNYHLPKQGNEWQQVRLNMSQCLPPMARCSKQWNDLLFERMCNVDPNQRLSAYELLLDPVVYPSEPTSRESLRHSLKQEREKNIVLNKKLLDHYLLSNTSDLQILPVDINYSYLQSQSSFLSPTQSLIVPQQQSISTPNDHSRILLVHSPRTPICCTNLNSTITSPGSLALKQQVKMAGSNLFRYYSSII